MIDKLNFFSLDIGEVKNILKEYMNKTNTHKEFISFIPEIASDYQAKIEHELLRTKMCANALLVCNDIEKCVTKDNWFIWARFLDVTENGIFNSINMLQPNVILNKIIEIVSDNNIIDNIDICGERYNLLQLICKLKHKYLND